MITLRTAATKDPLETVSLVSDMFFLIEFLKIVKINLVYSVIYINPISAAVQVETWHTRRRQTNGRCKRFHDREDYLSVY